MGQRNKVEGAALVPNGEGPADDLVEFFERQELGDGKLADRNEQRRPEQIDLVIHPGGAVPDFIRRWNAIAAGRGFPRETATDCSEVNFRAHFVFGHSAELTEPAEQGSPSGPCKRLAEHGFFYSGRLTDEHDFTEHRATRDRRWNHPRAAPALNQLRDVRVERLLLARGARH